MPNIVSAIPRLPSLQQFYPIGYSRGNAKLQPIHLYSNPIASNEKFIKLRKCHCVITCFCTIDNFTIHFFPLPISHWLRIHHSSLAFNKCPFSFTTQTPLHHGMSLNNHNIFHIQQQNLSTKWRILFGHSNHPDFFFELH